MSTIFELLPPAGRRALTPLAGILFLVVGATAREMPQPSASEVPADSGNVRQLSRVVVRADPLATYGSSALSLTADDIAGKYPSLPSVLEAISGVSIRRTGGIGEYAQASIRGSNAQQVQVVIDDIPLNAAAGGAADLGKIPLGAVQQLKVYRSIAPLEHFASNAGGLIEISTLPKRDVVQVEGEIGSYLYRKAGALFRATNSFGYLSAVVDYVGGENDYPYYYDPTATTPGGSYLAYKKNNYFDSFTGSLSARGQLGLSGLSTSTAFSTYKGGIFSAGDPTVAIRSFTEGSRISTTLKWDRSWKDAVSLEISGKGRYFSRRLVDPDSSFYLMSDEEIVDAFPYVEGMLQGSFSLWDHISLKALFLGEHERFLSQDIPRDQSSSPKAIRSAVAAGGEASWSTDRLELGLQAVYRYQIDRNLSYNAFALPSLGHDSKVHYPSLQAFALLNIRRLFSSLSLHGKYTTRAPNFQEKFGLSPGYIGNPGLRPETRREVTLGWAYHPLTSLKFSVTGYGGATHDRIVTNRQSQRVFASFNFDEVIHFGAELGVEYAPWPFLSFANDFDYGLHVVSDHPDTGVIGNLEPLQSPWKNSTRLSLSFRSFTLGHSLLMTGPYFTSVHNVQSNAFGPDAGMYASYQIHPRWTITGRADNYLNIINYDHYGFPRPGRTFSLRTTITFL